MSTTNTPEIIATSIDEPLERLLAFEPTTLPVISLYLNTQPDKHGHDQYEAFLRKELISRARTFASGTPERQSFDRDVERIQKYLEDQLEPAANGVALFACAGANDFFEAVQLTTPVEEHRLYVYHQPHLYHLTRLDEQYPRYAALVTDANSARIFVFGLGQVLESEQVKGKKVQRVKVGGWSQARYQRRVENAHSAHAKEAIDRLARLVEQEHIQYVILGADPAMIPVLKEQLPQPVAQKLVDLLQVDTKASDQQVLTATLDALRQQDAVQDAEKVKRLFEQYRAGGLAVVGPQETLEALANGQVDELLLSTNLEQTHTEEEPIDAILAPEIPDPQGSTETEEPRAVLMADLLVTKAKQTDAKVHFIEDPALLESVDGVGAFLRWRA